MKVAISYGTSLDDSDYLSFTKELINILNKTNIITLKNIDDFSRDTLINDLEKSLGYLDGNNIEGYIEGASVSESENILYYAEFKNNERLSINYASDNIKKELDEEIYNLTVNGRVLNFIVNNRLAPVIKEVKKENDSEVEYEIGEHIFHNLFKEGTILRVDDLILIILFKQGIKRIAKGHHSIKKIS